MLPRSAALILVAAVVALAGCAKTGFVKPTVGERARSYDFRETPESRRRSEGREQLAIATRELQAGELDAADRAARAALRADPASADANTVLAVISERRGRSAEAGALYRKAMELAPGRGAELNNYGAWLCGNGREGESLAYFEQALADSGYGQPAAALANAGACGMRAGDIAQVERNLRAALELDPENAVALEAMTEYRFGHGRYFDARAFSQRRLAVPPTTAAALQMAAQIEQRLGNEPAANRYLQRLHSEFPQAAHLQPRDASSP
ncbi:type IV pilus biogenesis/stability protein PilW [Luteimonas sp. BDR2-5]|nr:type IV pilus biogenesis/stability protein PilW [Luteimonas sp. BDR2-5]MCD9026985.1 type IV pilus biogenesis/stability protein PilW [Luteimonas sp. BDR2-5]